MPAYLSASHLVARLQRGDVLRMELGEHGARLYWLESPLAYVRASVVDDLGAHLVERGDSLLGLAGNSQSYVLQGEKRK